MTRCHSTAAPLAAWLGTCLSLSCLLGSLPTQAQTVDPTIVPMAIQRQLPVGSLRGELIVTNPPEVTLNGKADRLAPGSRIRGQNNMLVFPGAAVGQKLVVNYTRESYGLILDVWVLREDEMAKRWPKTAEEAAKWSFDPLTQTWTKP
jgi:hypothetical protein